MHSIVSHFAPLTWIVRGSHPTGTRLDVRLHLPQTLKQARPILEEARRKSRPFGLKQSLGGSEVIS